MGVFGAQGGEAPIVRHTGDKVFARLRFGVEHCAKSDLSACDPASSPPHSSLWPSRSRPRAQLPGVETKGARPISGMSPCFSLFVTPSC